ncbi:MAG: hypothetical protein AAF517_24335, partial [Planctomycetota bacterium]
RGVRIAARLSVLSPLVLIAAVACFHRELREAWWVFRLGSEDAKVRLEAAHALLELPPTSRGFDALANALLHDSSSKEFEQFVSGRSLLTQRIAPRLPKRTTIQGILDQLAPYLRIRVSYLSAYPETVTLSDRDSLTLRDVLEAWRKSASGSHGFVLDTTKRELILGPEPEILARAAASPLRSIDWRIGPIAQAVLDSSYTRQVLQRAFQSPEPRVRAQAARLAGPAGPDLVPLLVEALTDPCTDLISARALQHLGTSAKAALVPLQEATRQTGKDETFVLEAGIAYSRILRGPIKKRK